MKRLTPLWQRPRTCSADNATARKEIETILPPADPAGGKIMCGCVMRFIRGGLGKRKSRSSKASEFSLFGGRYKTRTCDLPHVKRMRYQLRQSSIFIGNGYSTRCRWICQYFFSVSHINRAFGGFSVAREDDLHRSCAYARHGAGAVFVGCHCCNVRVGR